MADVLNLVPPEMGDDDEPPPTPSPLGFDGLVENALAFFNDSFEEVSSRPKAAVINFYSGVELVLKARLLHEHWALVLAQPDQANLTKFEAGDFVSVNLEQAIRRLENICGEALKDEFAYFDSIRKHRNRLVHFFHPAYVGSPDPNAIADVAAEQFRAWLYLSRLFSRKWRDKFGKFEDQIAELDKKIHGNRGFLKVKFDALQTDFEKLRAAKIVLQKCDSCLFESCACEYSEPLETKHCEVCGFRGAAIVVGCPDCMKDKIRFDDTGEGSCSTCGNDLGLDYLLSEYGPDVPYDPKEDVQASWYCAQCERADQETVVPWGNGLLCLNCATTYAEYETGCCGYCNTPIAGLHDGSFLIGCILCDGRFGDDRD